MSNEEKNIEESTKAEKTEEVNSETSMVNEEQQTAN